MSDQTRSRKRRATIEFIPAHPKWSRVEEAWTHTWWARLYDSDVAVDQACESAPLGNWPGELYGVDRRFTCEITSRQPSSAVEADGYWFELVVQGKGPGGRRYDRFRTLTRAQEAATKWAARRFYYLNDDQRSEHEDRVRDLGAHEARRILRKGIPIL